MTKRSTLQACLSMFRIRAAEGLQYRLAALSGCTVGIFWALIEIIVLTVFFSHSGNGDAVINGLTLSKAVTYIWISQMLVPLQPMNVDNEILSKINSGDVGIELCRPLDLYFHWYAKTAAGRFNSFWIRASVLYIVGLLIPGAYGADLPASPLSFLLFLLSVGCALLLCSSFSMLASAIRLGVNWGDGPTYIIMLVAGVLSGGYLPLQLWPDFLQPFLMVQPFAGYLDIPARIYTGGLAAGGAVWGMGLQLCWTAGFVLLGRRIMSNKLKNVIVQGG